MKQCNNCGELRAYLNKKGVCILCENGKSPRGKIVKATGIENTKPFRGELPGGKFI